MSDVTSNDIDLEALSEGLSTIAEEVKVNSMYVDWVDCTVRAEAEKYVTAELNLELVLTTEEQIENFKDLLVVDS